MNRHKNHVEFLLHVASELGDLKDEVVFVGGAICGLLLTDPAAGDVRPTDDVDFIVQVTTYAQYASIQQRLEMRGFKHVVDEEGPICRMKIGSILVDVMPVSGVLGFRNEWYARAIETAEQHTIQNEELVDSINVVNAPLFVCTKLVAFNDRGKGDFFGSHDIEDIISVLNGRKELWKECWLMPIDVRTFLRTSFRNLLRDQNFLDAIPGMLSHGSTGRDKVIQRRMHTIANHLLDSSFSGQIDFNFGSSLDEGVEIAIISGNEYGDEIVFPTLALIEKANVLQLLTDLGIKDFEDPWSRRVSRLYSIEDVETSILARWNLLPPNIVY